MEGEFAYGERLDKEMHEVSRESHEAKEERYSKTNN